MSGLTLLLGAVAVLHLTGCEAYVLGFWRPAEMIGFVGLTVFFCFSAVVSLGYDYCMEEDQRVRDRRERLGEPWRMDRPPRHYE